MTTRRLQIVVDVEGDIYDIVDYDMVDPVFAAGIILGDPEADKYPGDGLTVLGAKWIGRGWADAPGSTAVDLEQAQTAIGILRKIVAGAEIHRGQVRSIDDEFVAHLTDSENALLSVLAPDPEDR